MPNKAPVKVSEFYVPPVGLPANQFALSFTATLFPSGGVATDSYPIANASGSEAMYTGATLRFGQAFTSSGGKITGARFVLSSAGSPTGNAYARIYATTGSSPNKVPTGSLLAESDPVDVTTVNPSGAIKSFPFSGANQITLTGGTDYAMVCEFVPTFSDFSNRLGISYDVTSPTDPGNAFSDFSGSITAVPSEDTIYYVDYLSSVAATLTRKVSHALSAGLSFVGNFVKSYIPAGGTTYTQSFAATLFQGVGGGGGTPDIVDENFEGTGTPSGWTAYAGSPNFDYSTSPLVGSQSLQVLTADATNVNFTSISEFWFKCYVRVNTMPGDTSDFVILYSAGFAASPLSVRLVAAGNIGMAHGSATTGLSTDGMSAGTIYNLWFHYKKGTGSNGIAELSFDVAGNPRPSSGNKYISVTTGTGTADPAYIFFNLFGGTPSITWDNVQVSSTDVFGGTGGGGWATLTSIRGKWFAATLSFVGALERRTSHGLTATLSFAGNLIRKTSHLLSATQSFAGALSRKSSKALSATLSFIGAFTKSFIAGGGHLFTQAFSATLFQRGLTDGDPVSTWPDSSGNSYNATQSGSARPTFKTNIINGKPVVRFDGVQNSLVIGFAAGTVFNSTVFVVGAVNVAAASQTSYAPFTTFGGAFGTAGNRILARLSSTPWGSYQTGTGELNTGEDLVSGVSNILVATSLQASGGCALYRNGVLKASNPTDSLTGSGLNEIGAESAASRFINADIAEILVYNSVLSSTDRANVEAYLGNKYGITVAGGSVIDPATVTGLVAWLKTDSISGGSTAALIRRTSHGLTAATQSFGGAIAKRSTRSLSATLSFIGAMTFAAVHHFTQALTATLSFIGTFSEKNVLTRFFTASLSSTAALAKSTGKALSATLGWSASLVRRITRVLSGTLLATGILVKAIRDAGFSATLSFVGNLVGVPAHFFARAFTATLSFTAAISTSRVVQRVLSATLAFSGAVQRRTGKALAATLSFSVATRKAIRKVLRGTLSFVGFLFRGGAVTILAGAITGALVRMGLAGSSAKIVKTGSTLRIERTK